MPKLHKKHLKALKRKRRVDGKREYERTMLKNSVVQMIGRSRVLLRKTKENIPTARLKTKKVLPTYRIVKLTEKLDILNIRIKEADANDPKLPSLKLRRDTLKAKITN